MQKSRLLKLSVRGVPVLPLLLNSDECARIGLSQIHHFEILPSHPSADMTVTLAAATLVASYNVSSSVTINTNFTFTLVSFTGANGAACGSGTTGAAFTSASYGSVSGSVASSTNSTQWCFKNTGNTKLFVGQFAPEVFFTTTSGSLPTGASESVKAWSGTLSTTSNYCIPIGGFQLFDAATCAIVQVPGSLVSQLTVASNTPSGTYSWTDTYNGYSTASG
jgi:hypothetical protein